MHWLLAGYMWLYVHRPFEVWPWLADLRIERVYMLVTLAYWACVQRKRWHSSRLHVAFGSFFLAVVLAWVASPFQEVGWLQVEDLLKIGVFYVLVVSSIHDERHLRFLIAAFLCSMALYMGHSLFEYANGRHVFRMGTARMVGVDSAYHDPNTFAASCLYALPMLFPFWRSETGKKARSLALGYALLTLTCILLTGSRTAFVGILVLATAVAARSKHRVKIAVAGALLLPAIWGMIPNDRKDRYLTLLDPSRGPANAQTSAEQRQVYFEMAYDLWGKSPLLGYGPGSFPEASRTGKDVHSLYGQLLAEVGLLGMIAFAFVLRGFAVNGRAIRRYSRDLPWRRRSFPRCLSVAALCSVGLLLLLGFGGHNLFRYTWMWYGAFQIVALACARKESTTFAAAAEAEAAWQAEFEATAVEIRNVECGGVG